MKNNHGTDAHSTKIAKESLHHSANHNDGQLLSAQGETVKRKDSKREDTTIHAPMKHFSACDAALNILGSIGSAVEQCFDAATPKSYNKTKQDELGGILDMTTFDTFEVHLLNDIQLYNRMNSWETNGTFTTVGTSNTNEVKTDTLHVKPSDLSALKSEREMKHKSMQQKEVPTDSITNISVKKRTKRAVNFEYPPISSMKECPRITEEEKKKLFFSEEELDVYEQDRKQILCDDVEVIAVEFTDSDESIGDEDRCDRESKRSSSNSVKRKEGISTMASNRQGKSTKNSSSVETVTTKDTACSCSIRLQKKSQGIKSLQKKKNHTGGKMKGVQIFLRQRTLG